LFTGAYFLCLLKLLLPTGYTESETLKCLITSFSPELYYSFVLVEYVNFGVLRNRVMENYSYSHLAM
jgi:hypothetical protein